jgi:hypothetical protein
MPTHDHGGTAIIVQFDHDGRLHVARHYGTDNLTGGNRRAVLHCIRAVIDAELGDRPDPAGVVPGDGPVPDGRADRSQLDILRDEFVNDVALHFARHGDGGIKSSADRWLAASDRA